MMKNEEKNYLLTIKDLVVHFHTLEGIVRALEGVSLHLEQGKTLGLVGESGCGKSVTAHSILRLLPPKLCKIKGGEILFRQRDSAEPIDLAKVDPQSDLIRSIRGHEIAMIFQEPMTSLAPIYTVGDQIMEAIMLHRQVSPEQARESAMEMLKAVALAENVVDEYPYRLSGGQRQRAMTAMALSCNPSLLIADEPTTALDVTIQAQILELLMSLQKEFNMAILMITHNLGVIAEMADEVAVMYLGRVVESGAIEQVLGNPLHPYTIGLLKSLPKMGDQTNRRLAPIPGSVPDPLAKVEGCPFHLRCPVYKQKGCDGKELPSVVEPEPGHLVRCVLYY
jgi:peptide/nickel transport system ATP-binding protein